jgi:hypothetical protein
MSIKNYKLNSEFAEKQRPNKFELFIDSINVPIINVINLNVREYAYSFLPIIELTLGDVFLWSEYNPIQEGQIIKLTLGSDKDSDPVIETEFEIVSFSHDQFQTGIIDSKTATTILGSFKANKIIGDIDSKSYKDMTATEVINTLGTELEVDVNVKIDSQDKMTWYRLNQSYMEFLNTILSKTNVGDNDAPFIYFDSKGILNFSSLKTALDNDIKITLEQIPALSDYPINGDDKIAFSSYSVQDKSGFVNKFGGNKTTYSYYDLEDLKNEEFDTDTVNTGLVELENKTKASEGITSRHIIFGSLNPSVHPDYFQSQTRNQYIRQTILSSNTIIPIPANSNIALLDKLYVQVKTAEAKQGVNNVYSGDYLVVGIVHNINKSDNYSMFLVLARDGQNKTKSYNEYSSSLIEVS